MDRLTADWLAGATPLSPPKPAPPAGARFVAGLDLGQLSDPSALAVVERLEEVEKGKPVRHLHVRSLHRWPLRTPYGTVVDDVVTAFDREPLTGSDLVLDRTGVGIAVSETLIKAKPKAGRIVKVSIHGGVETGRAPDGSWSVPKRELAGILQVLLGHNRLRFAEGLEHGKTIKKELEKFSVKININTGHESFEAWHKRDHDDLVLALALACWWSERGLRKFSFGL